MATPLTPRQEMLKFVYADVVERDEKMQRTIEVEVISFPLLPCFCAFYPKLG